MNFSDVAFTTLIVALVANLSLVLVVFRYAPRNESRYLFIFFVLAQIVWFVVNFFAIRSSADRILDMARWTIAAAVPHPLLFFLFVKSFSNKAKVLKKKFIFPGLVLLSFMVALARSESLFTGLDTSSGGGTPVAGPGMAVFGIYSFIFIFLAFLHIVRSWRHTQGLERAQWRDIGVGLLITFLLVLGLNFVVAVVLTDLTFVTFGHLFTLPFVVFTAYAMVRHKLLNMKVIASELAVILLNLILLIQLVNASTLGQFWTALVVLIGALIVGVLLVRSVAKEIEQKKILQEMAKKLELANIELKSLDKARAEFITMASHQLRTPPATIKWYLDAVKEGDFGSMSNETKKAIVKMEVINNGMISLIEDMLNVSRIERGTIEFHFEPTDMLAVVQSAYEQLVPMAEEKNLRLVFAPPQEKLPAIMADREKVKQVVNNLIDNAIKYSKKGAVTVKLERQGNSLVVTVTDEGKGIPAGSVDNIFKKFGRGKDSSKYSAGLGLGLYVAKIVIEQHKGKIWAESQGEGKGSSFKFELPLNVILDVDSEVDLKKRTSQNL